MSNLATRETRTVISNGYGEQLDQSNSEPTGLTTDPNNVRVNTMPNEFALNKVYIVISET